MVGPTASDGVANTHTTPEGKQQVFSFIKKLIPSISERNVIASLCRRAPGLRDRRLPHPSNFLHWLFPGSRNAVTSGSPLRLLWLKCSQVCWQKLASNWLRKSSCCPGANPLNSVSFPARGARSSSGRILLGDGLSAAAKKLQKLK